MMRLPLLLAIRILLIRARTQVKATLTKTVKTVSSLLSHWAFPVVHYDCYIASRSDSSSEEPRRQNPGHAPEKTQSAGGNDTEEDNGEGSFHLAILVFFVQ